MLKKTKEIKFLAIETDYNFFLLSLSFIKFERKLSLTFWLLEIMTCAAIFFCLNHRRPINKEAGRTKKTEKK